MEKRIMLHSPAGNLYPLTIEESADDQTDEQLVVMLSWDQWSSLIMEVFVYQVQQVSQF